MPERKSTNLSNKDHDLLVEIHTLLKGSNGGGLIRRVDEIELGCRKRIRDCADDMQKMLLAINAAEIKHDVCSYDPVQCADHEKRININSVKLTMMSVGSGGVAGAIVALVQHFA